MREDVLWWLQFVQVYNGVSLILENEWSAPDHVVSSDSCLIGGYMEGKFYHWEYERLLLEKKFDINQLSV